MLSDQEWLYTPVILEADVHEFKENLGYIASLYKRRKKRGKKKKEEVIGRAREGRGETCNSLRCNFFKIATQ